MREVLRDRVFYEESGGGVTFSGGEPLAQPEFLAALLDACRAAEIRNAVDTCGFAPRERLLALVPLVDLFLFDLKLVDDARHRALTGLPSAPILENLRALGDRSTRTSGCGYRSCPASTTPRPTLAATAASSPGCRGSAGSILLPYHRTGVPKFRRLGREFALADVIEPPSRERLETLAAIFRERGLDHEHRRLTMNARTEALRRCSLETPGRRSRPSAPSCLTRFYRENDGRCSMPVDAGPLVPRPVREEDDLPGRGRADRRRARPARRRPCRPSRS